MSYIHGHEPALITLKSSDKKVAALVDQTALPELVTSTLGKFIYFCLPNWWAEAVGIFWVINIGRTTVLLRASYIATSDLFFWSHLIKYANLEVFLVLSFWFFLWLFGFLPVLSEPTTVAGQLWFLAILPEIIGQVIFHYNWWISQNQVCKAKISEFSKCQTWDLNVIFINFLCLFAPTH